MKKILILGLVVISAVGFAKDNNMMGSNNNENVTMMGNNNNENVDMMGNNNHMNSKMMKKHMSGKRMKNNHQGHMNSGMMGNNNGHMSGIPLTEEEIRENKKKSILIQEKRLEIKKLMTENNIDWNQVEALDLEVAQLKSTYRIERMKKKHAFHMNNVTK